MIRAMRMLMNPQESWSDRVAALESQKARDDIASAGFQDYIGGISGSVPYWKVPLTLVGETFAAFRAAQLPPGILRRVARLAGINRRDLDDRLLAAELYRQYLAPPERLNPKDRRPEVCAIPGCGRASVSRGLCKTHYARTLTGKDKVEIGLSLGAGPSATVEGSIASGYGPAWSELGERDKDRIIKRVEEAIEKKQSTLERFDPLLFATRCGVNAAISAFRAAQTAPRILARQTAKEEVRSKEQLRVMELRKLFPQISEEFVRIAQSETAKNYVRAVAFRSVWRDVFCGIPATEKQDTVLKRRYRMREQLANLASKDLLGLLAWDLVDVDFKHIADLRAQNDPERLPAEVPRPTDEQRRLADQQRRLAPRPDLPERGVAVRVPNRGGGRATVDLTPWKHLFSEYSDRDIAAMSAVSYNTVRKYRELWGIPFASGRRGRPKG